MYDNGKFLKPKQYGKHTPDVATATPRQLVSYHSHVGHGGVESIGSNFVTSQSGVLMNYVCFFPPQAVL